MNIWFTFTVTSRNCSNLSLLVQVRVVNCIFYNCGEVACETLEWATRNWNTRWACALQACRSIGRRFGERDRTRRNWTIVFKLRMLRWWSRLCHAETSIYEMSHGLLKYYSTNTPGKASREGNVVFSTPVMAIFFILVFCWMMPNDSLPENEDERRVLNEGNWITQPFNLMVCQKRSCTSFRLLGYVV